MAKISKILYTPPRGIGDMIFSLPLLHSLKHAYPQAEIFIPITKDKQQILNLIGFPNTTKRYLPKPSQDPLAMQRWRASVAGDTKRKYQLEKLIYETYLSGEEFDIALIPKDFTINSINCPVQFCNNNLSYTKNDLQHRVDHFLKFADVLDIPKIMDFSLNLNENGPPILSSGKIFPTNSSYIVLNLSASLEKKIWSEKGYSNISSWATKNGYNVILTGDKNSFDLASRIKRNENKVTNTLLRKGYSFDLKNIALLSLKAEAFISPDTGVLHIADAVGAKVIGLYGPTSPLRYSPYQNQNNIISRFQKDRDIKKISSKKVIKKLKKILKNE